MTTTRVSSFTVEALPEDRLDEIREAGVDPFGNPVEVSVDREGGSPLRCCLRDSTAGEEVALIAWSPFDRPGPYAEVGPIFVHPRACGGYDRPEEYPEGFRHRDQVFRCYGHDGRIVGGEVVSGADAEAVIERLFARPEVALIHSRNIVYGCYMFAIRRAPAR